jgi:maltooligosyltrehalose trehalohydrolase
MRMHIGTFTQVGTWEATQRELQELASIGVNTLEIMPIAEFPGAFG